MDGGRGGGLEPMAVAHEVRAEIGEQGSEAFIQPDVGPPVHRDQIPKPLVSDLVADDVRRADTRVRGLCTMRAE